MALDVSSANVGSVCGPAELAVWGGGGGTGWVKASRSAPPRKFEISLALSSTVIFLSLPPLNSFPIIRSRRECLPSAISCSIVFYISGGSPHVFYYSYLFILSFRAFLFLSLPLIFCLLPSAYVTETGGGRIEEKFLCFPWAALFVFSGVVVSCRS